MVSFLKLFIFNFEGVITPIPETPCYSSTHSQSCAGVIQHDPTKNNNVKNVVSIVVDAGHWQCACVIKRTARQAIVSSYAEHKQTSARPGGLSNHADILPRCSTCKTAFVQTVSLLRKMNILGTKFEVSAATCQLSPAFLWYMIC